MLAHSFYFCYTLEEVHLAIDDVLAFVAGAQLFYLLVHLSVFCFKELVDAHFVYQFKAGLVLVVAVQCFVQVGIGAGAGGGIVQVGIQCFFHIAGEEALSHKGYEYMPELCLPFLAMWRRFMLKMLECEHMSQLMQQGDEEAIGVQVGINADAVEGRVRHGMAVIAQHTFALMRNGEVNSIGLKEWRYLLKCAMR